MSTRRSAGTKPRPRPVDVSPPASLLGVPGVIIGADKSSLNGSQPNSAAAAAAASTGITRSRSASFGFGETGPSGALTTSSADDGQSVLGSPAWAVLCCGAGGRGSLSWTGLGVVCSLLAVGSLGIHLLLDMLGDQLEAVGLGAWYTTLGVIAVLLAMIAVPLTHGLVGVRKNGAKVYTFFQPFVGGLRFVLLQVLAWSLWTATVLGGVYGVWVGGKKLTSGWLSAVGVGGVVSQMLVLISLHFFVSNVSTTQREELAAIKLERARSTRMKAREAKRKKHEAAKAKSKAGGRNNRLSTSDLSAEELRAEAALAEVTSPLTPPTTSDALAAAAARSSMWPWSGFAMKLTFLVIATLSLLLAAFVESSEHVSPSTTVSLQSLLTSAILLAVPITHLLARRSLTHAGYLLFQPFKGGAKFVALQAIAWTLWTLAFVSAGASFVAMALGDGHSKSHGIASGAKQEVIQLPGGPIPWAWLSNLITSAGVGGILSQALVLLSLKYFDSRISRKIGTTARVLEMVRADKTAGGTPAASRPDTPAPTGAATPAEIEREVYDRAVQVLSSPAAMQARLLRTPLVLSSPPSSTRNTRASPAASGSGTASTTHAFSFPSPSSTSASSSIGTPKPKPPPHTTPRSAVASTVEEDVTEDDGSEDESAMAGEDAARNTRDGVVEIGETMGTEYGGLTSPDLVSPEPSFTLARVTLKDLRQSLSLAFHYYSSLKWASLFRETMLDARSLLVISVFYMVPIVGAIGVFAPFVVMYQFYPLPWWFYTIYGTFVLMYISTYRNRPWLTGARSWPAFRHSDMLWSSMQRYFNGQIIALGDLHESKGPYIFGFHPHGIYPTTCFWATRGPQFAKSYPGLMIDICGASIMFHAPLLREIVMWAGGREVSGSAIRYALKQKRSIMLVPGGQREMRHSNTDSTALTLVTRHRGFIRMALEHGTPLVPVLSIGETMLLENVHAPRMQAYTLRTVGVGFPIWPYGRWYSPLPNPHPVVVVFGHPITVPLNKDPSTEVIEEIHRVYFGQLQAMFEVHKHMVPGFEHSKLIFTEE